MTFWIGLWKLCLIGGLVIFAALAVVVTIGGALDTRRLVAGLRDDTPRADE